MREKRYSASLSGKHESAGGIVDAPVAGRLLLDLVSVVVAVQRIRTAPPTRRAYAHVLLDLVSVVLVVQRIRTAPPTRRAYAHVRVAGRILAEVVKVALAVQRIRTAPPTRQAYAHAVVDTVGQRRRHAIRSTARGEHAFADESCALLA